MTEYLGPYCTVSIDSEFLALVRDTVSLRSRATRYLGGARATRGLGANDSRELSMEGMFRSEPLVAAVTVWERRAYAVIVNEDAHTRVASGQS